MALIRHLLSSRSASGHGVHSPFVFDFLTTVVRGKNDALIIRQVEGLRREMLADTRVIRVTDLGAGSAVHKGEERRVSEIASMAALPTRYSALLSRIAGSIVGVPPVLREDVHREANMSGKTEEKDPLSFKEQGYSAGEEAAEIQSRQVSNARQPSDAHQVRDARQPSDAHQVRESFGKAIISRSHGAEGQEPDERHEAGQEQVESHAGGQEPDERHEGGQEQGELSQKHARLPVIPGPDGSGIILELGTSLGISTLALALAAPERRVVSVEGCPALAEIARENLRRHGAANAEILNMEFSEALSLLRKEGTHVSMAFIDGNHRGEALKQYVSEIMTMGDEMIIVADDIHLNRDMYNAWRSLAYTASSVPARRKVPSTVEKMPTMQQAIAPATAGKMPPVHQAIAPATAEKMPTVHHAIAQAIAEKTQPAQQAIAPATAEKMPPVYPGPAPATMETSRFGILFRRQSLTPRHYRIRY